MRQCVPNETHQCAMAIRHVQQNQDNKVNIDSQRVHTRGLIDHVTGARLSWTNKPDRAMMLLHTLCKAHKKPDRAIMLLHTLCKAHKKPDRAIMWLHTFCKPHNKHYRNKMFLPRHLENKIDVSTITTTKRATYQE